MKTNLDSLVMTDSDLEKEGIEFEYGPVVFTVRRFGGRNPKLKAAHAKYFKQHSRAIEMGTMEDSKLEEITIKAFVDSCMVKWSGLKDGEGKEIPYSAEGAFTFFKERSDLFNAVLDYAKDHRNYLKDEYFQAESVGN